MLKIEKLSLEDEESGVTCVYRLTLEKADLVLIARQKDPFNLFSLTAEDCEVPESLSGSYTGFESLRKAAAAYNEHGTPPTKPIKPKTSTVPVLTK